MTFSVRAVVAGISNYLATLPWRCSLNKGEIYLYIYIFGVNFENKILQLVVRQAHYSKPMVILEYVILYDAKLMSR